MSSLFIVGETAFVMFVPYFKAGCSICLVKFFSFVKTEINQFVYHGVVVVQRKKRFAIKHVGWARQLKLSLCVQLQQQFLGRWTATGREQRYFATNGPCRS